MTDQSFPTLDPDTGDSVTIWTAKKGLTWRAVEAVASSGGGGSSPNFVGQEWDTDANQPTFDTDSNATIKDTDT